ncbi:MAG: hypothetical protein Q8R79_00235 [Legionellaceae bacterium]|nr:hypothetical protein [Legionellaceae bacterium]
MKPKQTNIDQKSNKSSENQEPSEPDILFKKLSEGKDKFIDLVLDNIDSKKIKEAAKYELNKAFDYTIEYCKRQHNQTISFFMLVFSDLLWVTEAAIQPLLTKLEFHISPSENHSSSNSPVLSEQAENKPNPNVNKLQSMLPAYSISTEQLPHPLFGNEYISCYPQERFHKVDLYTRFSEKYTLPEKQSNYARPILDIEFIEPDQLPCVRCYLTLTNRPRPNSADKDITQNEEGNIIFANVYLMNFGDPLRAFTWAEDYVNNPEHGKIGTHEPIIRSFLIPLSAYKQIIAAGGVVPVDRDRAPGQVKTLDAARLHAIPNSLMSFMNHPQTHKKDGVIHPLEKLGEYLLGRPIHPKDIASPPHIAHQYGRVEESSEEKKYWENNNKEFMIPARRLEREQAGFALYPEPNKNTQDVFFKPKKKKKSVNEEDLENSDFIVHKKKRP